MLFFSIEKELLQGMPWSSSGDIRVYMKSNNIHGSIKLLLLFLVKLDRVLINAIDSKSRFDIIGLGCYYRSRVRDWSLITGKVGGGGRYKMGKLRVRDF